MLAKPTSLRRNQRYKLWKIIFWVTQCKMLYILKTYLINSCIKLYYKIYITESNMCRMTQSVPFNLIHFKMTFIFGLVLKCFFFFFLHQLTFLVTLLKVLNKIFEKWICYEIFHSLCKIMSKYKISLNYLTFGHFTLIIFYAEYCEESI